MPQQKPISASVAESLADKINAGRRKWLVSAATLAVAGACAIAGTPPPSKSEADEAAPEYVGSIASMRALSRMAGARDAQQVNLKAYHPRKAGGGGLFYFDATCPKSAHDGGTVISSTCPWDGRQESLAGFLSADGERDPQGAGCWRRVFDERYIHAQWFGVVGGNGDETAAFLAAKRVADSLPNRYFYLPARMVELTLDEPLVFTTQGAGLFGTGVDPYIYSSREKNVSGLLINGGLAGEEQRAALVFDGIGQCAGNFALMPGPNNRWYWPLDTCTYSGEFLRIRTTKFMGGQRVYNSVTYGHEANNNKFEMVECYATRKGLRLGVNPVSEARQVAFNENTWLNCRYRGNEYCLYLFRDKTPKAYGNVFINCIFQERAKLGDGDFEMLKSGGGQVEGVTFVNGRFECPLEKKRQRPVINLNGLSRRSLCTFIGTYIHSGITVIDDFNSLHTLGTVRDPAWMTRTLRACSLVSRGVEEMSNQLNQSNAIRWTGQGSADQPTRQWMESPFAEDLCTSVGYGGKYRKGSAWAENLIEFCAGKTTCETKMWVDNVPMTRTVLGAEGKSYAPAGDADMRLGTAHARWAEVHTFGGLVQAADAKRARDVRDIPASLLEAWAEVPFHLYRFDTGTRTHVGVLAQEIEGAFRRHGLDAVACGILSKEDVACKTTGAAQTVWGVYPDACLFLECALQRSRWENIKKQKNT